MHGMRLTPDVIPFVSTAYRLVASRNANTQLPNGFSSICSNARFDVETSSIPDTNDDDDDDDDDAALTTTSKQTIAMHSNSAPRTRAFLHSRIIIIIIIIVVFAGGGVLFFDPGGRSVVVVVVVVFLVVEKWKDKRDYPIACRAERERKNRRRRGTIHGFEMKK